MGPHTTSPFPNPLALSGIDAFGASFIHRLGLSGSTLMTRLSP
jgi:hypothetical protein